MFRLFLTAALTVSFWDFLAPTTAYGMYLKDLSEMALTHPLYSKYLDVQLDGVYLIKQFLLMHLQEDLVDLA